MLKASIVNTITTHNGLDISGLNLIFAFRGEKELFECRAAIPRWAKVLGPYYAAQYGQPVIPAIATAHVIRATNKVIPDVVIDYFFQQTE